ncbi:MAG: hypothetical protein AB7I41_20410 [Candidatus Sericytochromatia bacterium]
MFSLQFTPFLITLLASALLDFYLCLLVHWRYCGQFGLWFFLPMGVVFSLPSLFVLGLPLYLILIAPATWPQKIALLAVLAFILLRLLRRLTRQFLSKRFPRDRSPHSAATESQS